MHVIGNRCTINMLFSHIFIRIQVGYTVQYIDIQKSYSNLNKYMAKKRVLMHFIPVQGKTVNVDLSVGNYQLICR